MAYNQAIATATLFCEASNQPRTAKTAVAWVLKNRASKFNWTVAQVCLDRKDFSCWNDDPVNNANLLRFAKARDDDPVLIECSQIVDSVLRGLVPDPTNGATHYYDDSIAAPYWAAPPARKMCKIGRLIFYANVP